MANWETPEDCFIPRKKDENGNKNQITEEHENDDSNCTEQLLISLLDNLNRDNCCEKLLTLLRLAYQAWIRKYWWCYYKNKKWEEYVPTKRDERVAFRDCDVLITEKIFNEGKEISGENIQVCPRGLNPLLFSEMKKEGDDEYWNTIIHFVNHNTKHFLYWLKHQ